MKFPERVNPESLDRDTTYRSCFLWLPLSKINIAAIKAACTVTGMDDRTKTEYEVPLYEETATHLVVPREFFPVEDLPPPVVECRLPGTPVQFEDNIVLRENQMEAWTSLFRAKGGILNLGCGKGKTVCALKKIAYEGRAALVILPNTGLISQWRDEIKRWLGLPESDIGLVQQSKAEWDKPIVLASLQTLARRVQEKPLPWEIREHFGIVIFDEVHHLSAKLFSLTAPIFPTMRFGLSATPYRSDGLEGIYMGHLGKVFHSDISNEIEPRVFFQRLGTAIQMEDPRILDRIGNFNIGKFWKTLGEHEGRNKAIVEQIKEARGNNRKILALTHSKAHAQLLHQVVPLSGLVDGEVAQNERQRILKAHDVIFATTQVAQEGLDAPMLDTVFFLTPFKEWNIVQQGIGRTLRAYPGKKHPVAVFFWDKEIGAANAMCRSVMREMRNRGWRYQTVP